MLSIFKSFSMHKMRSNLSIPRCIFYVAIFNEFIALGLDMAYGIEKMTYGTKGEILPSGVGEAQMGVSMGTLFFNLILVLERLFLGAILSTMT